MNAARLAATMLLLLACSSPAVCGGCGTEDPVEALPDSFRILAHVDSAEGPGARNCTPGSMELGKTWAVEFARMHDAVEPTFKEIPGPDRRSFTFDGAALCQLDDAARDCCDPLVDEGGMAVLRCRGARSMFPQTFTFAMSPDGSGSSVTVATSLASGEVVGTSRTSWTAIEPL